MTRLFSAPERSSPELSRHGSYIRTSSGTTYTRASTAEPAPLPHHLYQRGLISGRHSDITVNAFGTKYALHRLLLDQAPFFESALSGPWLEASSSEIQLRPEEVDSNITQAAFELALKRLYGCSTVAEEEKEAASLFATACWLEMSDLIESSVNALLRQMSPSRLSGMIRMVTNQYYGNAGDRILEAAKAMLCREGWEMPIRYWDNISGEIAREIIGNDGFFVSGEWERWILAKRLLDRRLRHKAVEAGLYDENDKSKRGPPKNINFLAIRFDTVYRRQSTAMARYVPESYDPWLALYTSPDIAAILVLLDEGIHYFHLTFEQLQQIRLMTDVLGLPVMPEKVITDALWMSMDLRQRVQNANLDDQELGLAEEADEIEEGDAADNNQQEKDAHEPAVASSGKGKEVEREGSETADEGFESGSWDGNGLPRKFWIPYMDSTHTRGSSYAHHDQAFSAASNSRPATTRHLSRLSATLDPHDMQWASDFTASNTERPRSSGKNNPVEPAAPLTYSHYPPFRFSAEFPHPSAIQEKKRIYSRTVWYAGSLWNVYVQKVANTKTPQLGVYLHRAKAEHPTDDPRHGASVDERIGQVEMLLRRNNRARYRYDSTANDADDDPDSSSGDPEVTLRSSPAGDTARAATISNLLLRGDGVMKASQNPRALMLLDRNRLTLPGGPHNGTDESSNDSTTDVNASRKARVPTLPPYSDNRPTIKTYFKIYSPSKGGRTLSVYESAPDKFNFSQSWGWKSSTLLVDDEVLDYEEGGVRGNTRNGRLRFMVVIGVSSVLLPPPPPLNDRCH